MSQHLGMVAGAAIPVPTTTLSELVESRVARSPSAIALVSSRGECTYGTLNDAANEVAAMLRKAGAGPDQVVGICLPRGEHMVVAVLAVMKAGAAYLFLDPDYPQKRLEFMVTTAASSTVVTCAELHVRVSSFATSTVVLDTTGDVIERGAPNLVPMATSSNLAYVVFTSGSTGDPKAVAVEHRSAVSYFAAGAAETNPSASDTVLQFVNASFDPFLREVFGTLLAGATLFLLRGAEERSPEAIVELLASGRITMVSAMGPSLLERLLDIAEIRGLRWPVRMFAVSAEPFYPATARRLSERLDGGTIINQYGVAEATMISTRWTYRGGLLADGSLPVGQPISNVWVSLIDELSQPVEVGEVGEVIIGGAGVARGYLSRPDLTAERFQTHPSVAGGGRFYRTGDLARWRPDGDLEFIGRADFQGKPRGQRTELGEVEGCLRSHPSVRQAVAMVSPDRYEDSRLVAYIVPVPESLIAVDELRAYMADRVPAGRIPERFITLAALPLNPNGKLDRNALPAVDRARPPLTYPVTPPSTATERRIAEVWADVLAMEPIGTNDNFFHLGGHQFLAVTMAKQLQRATSCEVTSADIMCRPTVGKLAALIERRVIEASKRPGDSRL